MKKLALLSALLLFACSKNKDQPAALVTNPLRTCHRAEPIAPDTRTEACKIRLVSPAPCDEIDLTSGNTVRVIWENEGTGCRTPYFAYIGGNPISRDDQGNLLNVEKFQIPASHGVVDGTKGEVGLRAIDLRDLTSTDGTFEWVIEDSDGAHPVSQILKVKR